MKLPPLRAAKCFEAVARYNSFSLAANAMNITQSAVSHQVKILEEYLGEQLLIRQGRRLSLTPIGERYFEEINIALSSISIASENIRVGESGQIRLSVYSSLAVKWLIPRLDSFRQQYPDLELSLNMVADDPVPSDQIADCFISVIPPKKGYHADLLYKETLYPVCSQKLWQSIKEQPLPEALWQQPLLSVKSMFVNGDYCDDWQRWCQLGGFSLPKEARLQNFSHLLLAAEAACYNQGITFLNQYMMTEHDKEHLVRIPMHELPTGDNYYFIYKKSRAKQSAIIKLGRWLKQQCYEAEH